jgi:hypothetical protein
MLIVGELFLGKSFEALAEGVTTSFCTIPIANCKFWALKALPLDLKDPANHPATQPATLTSHTPESHQSKSTRLPSFLAL